MQLLQVAVCWTLKIWLRQATLSVLVLNYTFKLRDGPDTKFGVERMVFPRPTVIGEEGCRVPLRVRRVD
jgi:hypothetical protein